ncbi:putative inactive ATP-dependent zinc metalloprotease FTSHI 5, chloroplastic [Asimina triloba]
MAKTNPFLEGISAGTIASEDDVHIESLFHGVLIVGENGTGKTSLALAIAAEAKVPVVEIKARQLEGGLWVGQSASNVRELFQTARDLAPVILFVEDFDLFSGVRGKATSTKEQEHESFINQLLVELDGFDKQDGVVLLATTSNLKHIDPALQRPGRMDRVLHVQPLTQAEREKILRIAAEETMDDELIGFVDWKKEDNHSPIVSGSVLQLPMMGSADSVMRGCDISHFIGKQWYALVRAMDGELECCLALEFFVIGTPCATYRAYVYCCAVIGSHSGPDLIWSSTVNVDSNC